MFPVYAHYVMGKNSFILYYRLTSKEERKRYLEHNNDVNDATRYQSSVKPIISTILNKIKK